MLKNYEDYPSASCIIKSEKLDWNQTKNFKNQKLIRNK